MTVKIERVTGCFSHCVEVDNSEFTMYTRHSSDCWTVRIGESEEPVYDCKEIEAAFQEYLKSDLYKEVMDSDDD